MCVHAYLYLSSESQGCAVSETAETSSPAPMHVAYLPTSTSAAHRMALAAVANTLNRPISEHPGARNKRPRWPREPTIL